MKMKIIYILIPSITYALSIYTFLYNFPKRNYVEKNNTLFEKFHTVEPHVQYFMINFY